MERTVSATVALLRNALVVLSGVSFVGAEIACSTSVVLRLSRFGLASAQPFAWVALLGKCTHSGSHRGSDHYTQDAFDANTCFRFDSALDTEFVARPTAAIHWPGGLCTRACLEATCARARVERSLREDWLRALVDEVVRAMLLFMYALATLLMPASTRGPSLVPVSSAAAASIFIYRQNRWSRPQGAHCLAPSNGLAFIAHFFHFRLHCLFPMGILRLESHVVGAGVYRKSWRCVARCSHLCFLLCCC